MIRSKKNFFKVWVVGTLNLCLKVPKKMRKTRNQSDHPRLRKRPKTVKNRPDSNVAYFLSLDWSDSSIVYYIFLGTLRQKLRVPTTHTVKKFFRPYKGGCAILNGNLGKLKQLQMSCNFSCELVKHSIIRKYNALNEYHKIILYDQPYWNTVETPLEHPLNNLEDIQKTHF